MEVNYGVLRLLEGIRFPLMDQFMLLITHLGEETAFLVVALVIFWCVDKRKGYYVLSAGFIGTIVNQCMKLLFRVPRPWLMPDPVKPVEAAVPEATGFSFPSGHTQSAMTTFGGIARTAKHRITMILGIAACVLVAFSRMYLGVHTPQDVLFSVAFGLVLIFAVHPVVYKNDGKYFPWLLMGMTALSFAYLIFVHCFPFPADMDQEQLYHGVENAYTLLGALLGLLVVYFVDEKWLSFQVQAVWWAQLCKVGGGLIAVLAVKEGLRDVLTLAFSELPGRAVRYFLIVVVAGILWPLTFRWFAGLGNKE